MEKFRNTIDYLGQSFAFFRDLEAVNLDYIWQQRFRVPEYVVISQYH